MIGKTDFIRGFDVKQSVFTVPMNGWDKPVYMEYEGALRAFKFLRIEFHTDNVDNDIDGSKLPKPVYKVRIAGVTNPVLILGDSEGDFPIEYALTVEKYLNGDYDYNTAAVNPDVWLKQCLNAGFHSMRMTKNYTTLWKAVRYIWNGVRAVETPVPFCETILYDYNNGFHFKEPVDIDIDNSYADKEGCEDDNNVTVIEFKAGELD